MKIDAWLPLAFIGSGLILIGIGLIIWALFIRKRKTNDEHQKQERYCHLPLKDIDELKVGQTIIIIDHDQAGVPVIQFTDEFAWDLPQDQRHYFLLQNTERFTLEAEKTYEVEKFGKAQIVNLKQVAMMFY